MTPEAKNPSRKTALFLAAAAAVATFLIYLPALSNGFVRWDDQHYVTENPFIRSLDIGLVKYAFTEPVAGTWLPLTLLSYAFDHALWGLQPFGYHLTNNLLHAVNTSLVFLLALKLSMLARGGGERSRFFPPGRGGLASALTAALLFGLHPLHVESVAWVAERKDVLGIFFYLLSILSYLKYSEGPYERPPFYFLALFLFVLSALSKAMAVSLPVVLLILDFYPLRRISRERLFRVFKEKLPFVVLTVALIVVTVWAQGHAIAPVEKVPLYERLGNAAWAYFFYLYKMAVPLDLTHFYPLEAAPLASFKYAAPAALFLALSAASVIVIGRLSAFSALWFFYVVTLLPVIGIVQVGAQAAADRYTYLPSVAPFVLAGALAGRFIERCRGGVLERGAYALLAIAFVALSALTVRQISFWKDSVALWTRQAGLYPVNLSFINRADAYKAAGMHREAIADYERILSNTSGDEAAIVARLRVSIADSYYMLRELDSAIFNYEAALRLSPADPSIHLKIGNALYDKGSYALAARAYAESARLAPENALPYLGLGLSYRELGERDEALKHLSRAAGMGLKEAAEIAEGL